MPSIKNVGDVLANAVVRERSGQSAQTVAGDAIAAILKNGVTHDERNAVANMLQNLKGTPHADLAQLIFNGVAKGADASTLDVVKEKLVGIQAPTEPSVSWRQDVPTDAQQTSWNTAITDRQIALTQVNGAVDRGFHQKQIFGGGASLKVNADLDKDARIPPFWDAKTDKPVADLSTIVRFSNGQGCPFKDAGPDVRGLAASFIDKNAQRWDALTTNKQTFAEDVPQFIGFAKASTAAELRGDDIVGELRQSAILAKEIGPVQAGRISLQLGKDTVLHEVNDVTTENYDGGAFKTKDGHLAKLLFTPVPGAVETMSRGQVKDDVNGLTTGVYKHFQSGPIKMRVQMKIFCGNGDELKANDKWDPAKIVDIGELTIAKPPKDEATDKLVQTLTGAVRFNPGTGFDPAGQMSLARGAQEGVNSDKVGIYETSQNNRHAFKNDDRGVMRALQSVADGKPDVALLKEIATEHERRQGLLKDLAKSGQATPENLAKLFAQVTAEWNARK